MAPPWENPPITILSVGMIFASSSISAFTASTELTLRDNSRAQRRQLVKVKYYTESHLHVMLR